MLKTPKTIGLLALPVVLAAAVSRQALGTAGTKRLTKASALPAT